MDAYWLEQVEADVPTEDQWLSETEMASLHAMRYAKRRADWRLGRWTAKRALASCLDLADDADSLPNIEIRALPSGAPDVLLFQQKADIAISLSHRSGTALCFVGVLGDSSLGCDLEIVEPRSNAFVSDFFTANERRVIEAAPPEHQPLLVTLLWSAKESALKALQVGLRLDTTCMEVTLDNGAAIGPWSPLRVQYANTGIFSGWWRHADDLVRTVVFPGRESETRFPRPAQTSPAALGRGGR